MNTITYMLSRLRMIQKHLLRPVSFLPSLLLVLLCAALFRITNLNYIEFKTDEGINLFLASRPLFGYPMPPGGTVSSVGVLNFPLFNYLLFPAVFLSTDPRWVSFFIALLNVLSIGGFFMIIRKYYDSLTALISSLLLAFAPWAILYSRKIWAQDLIVPLFVPLLFSIFAIQNEKKKQYWFLYALCSLLLFQLHQAAIFFLIPLTIFFLLTKPPFSLKSALIGGLLGMIPIIPYLLFQLSSGCPDCSSVLTAVKKSSEANLLLVFLRPLQIINQGGFYTIIGSDSLLFVSTYKVIYLLRQLFYLEYLLLPLGILLFWKENKNTRFLLYAVITLPIIYFLRKVEPLMHYFIMILPLLFLFIGFGLARLILTKSKLLKAVAITLTTVLVITSLLFNYAFFSLVKKNEGLAGDYGTAFIASERITDSLYRNVRQDPDYKEMILASYVPRTSMIATYPLARISYNLDQVKKSLPILEKRMIEQPRDMRTQHQLMAYYSNPLTRQSIAALRKKSKTLPVYQPMYKELYSYYLSQNYNQVFRDQVFGITFEFPTYWKYKSSYPKQIALYVDNYTLFITNTQSIQGIPTIPFQHEQSTLVLGQKVQKRTCIDQKNRWCGVVYDPVRIGTYFYQIRFTFSGKNIPSRNDSTLVRITTRMDEVVSSLRYLNGEVLP